MNTHYNSFQILAAVIVMVLSVSCIDNDNNNWTLANRGAQIPLSINDPIEVETRSVATANERTFDDMYLLAFDKTSGKYKGGERIEVSTQLVNNGSKNQILTSYIAVADGDKVVILGNTYCSYPSETIPLTIGSSTVDDINAAFPSTSWGFKGDGNGKGLPMSGTMVYGAGAECVMIRSVAKIELIFDEELAQYDVTGQFYWGNRDLNFGLYYVLDPTKGCIYAPQDTSGCVIPDGIVAGDFQHAAYDNPLNNGLQEHSCFYTVEYPCATKAKLNTVSDTRFEPERMGIGIGAGDNNFYRIDLYDHKTGKYLDVRRNCHYQIKISKVKSQGYHTLPEAFKNPASNIEYEIIVTGENDNLVESNGQYALALDCDELIVFQSADEEFSVAKVKLIDNAGYAHPTTTITASSGITLSGTIAVTTVEQEIKAKMSKETTEGTITVKVGNISRTIRIFRHEAFDAHPGVASFTMSGYPSGDLQNKTNWTHKENDVRLEYSGGQLKVICGESIVPDNINVLENKSTDAVFTDKSSVAYIMRGNGENGRSAGVTKVVVLQKAPMYVGWLGGNPNVLTSRAMVVDNMPTFFPKRLIMEAIEEEDQLQWCTSYGKTDDPDGAACGLENTNIVMHYSNPQDYKAFYYCYMKNDLNGNGTIDAHEPLRWYLPSRDQLRGVYCNYLLFNELTKWEMKYGDYWTSSQAIVEPRNTFYVGFRGRAFGKSQAYAKNELLHVRCVRDLDL